MKKIICIITAIILLASLASCEKKEASDSPSLKKITIALDYTPNTNHAGLYVAKDKGFFKDAGYNVEIIQPSEDGAEVMVASGQAQFGVSFQENVVMARASDSPLPIIAVAAVLEHNTSGILSLKEKNITRPKDMEGKKYATWDLPVEKETLKTVIGTDGGDFNKVTMISSTVTDAVSAMKTEVDCVWVFYGWDGIAAEVQNVETNYFAFSDIDPVLDFYTPVIISNEDYLDKNKDDAKKIMDAIKKGYRYTVENIDEAKTILLDNAPEIGNDLCVASLNYLKDKFASDMTKWGYIEESRWNGFSDWLYSKGIISKQPDEGFRNIL